MTAAAATSHFDVAFSDDSTRNRPLLVAFVLSLVLHALALLFLPGLRPPVPQEKALTVKLVKPEPEPIPEPEPPKAQPKPALPKAQPKKAPARTPAPTREQLSAVPQQRTPQHWGTWRATAACSF